ncbi:DUF4113 domain-containing protein [Vibrio parahaemolyticus]|uniref:DUF4113 domain-containing protein n=1 Tax=Vibrio parahaemolyticus TaxID=670 RepID=UPI00356B680D
MKVIPILASAGITGFESPAADSMQLVKIATHAATQLFKPGVRYYKIGIGLIDLVNGQHEQLDLLNQTPSNDKLMKVFDGLNNRYGTDTLFVCSQGIEQKWSMRREKLTPQYTTNWLDIPKVRC